MSKIRASSHCRRRDWTVEMPGNKKVRALFFSLSRARALYAHISRSPPLFGLRHFFRSLLLSTPVFLCALVSYTRDAFQPGRRRIYFHASTPRFATIFCHQKQLNESEFLNRLARNSLICALPSGTRPSLEILLLMRD
jgi:hypothetical protein